MKTPKYSIIVPTYNGLEYLPACIETIISQNYQDYELILSDDHSKDGTREYLEALDHPNIKIIYPPDSLSMTEHWEWALSHAKGEWQIFVGQDDGLQAYFFELADRLTLQAQEGSYRAIMSSRAYWFWPGCEHVYGDVSVGYVAENKTRVLNIKFEALKALLGLQDYFELPQMYTTALFHKSLLNDARSRQEGKVFSCHPQDANLAAIACSLESKYLKSYIPLGWVGTSPKSAGMAISESCSGGGEDNPESNPLKTVYLKKVSNSKLKYHELAGDFAFGSGPLYFWQALLMTPHLRSKRINRTINSIYFKTALFSSILYRIKFPKNSQKRSNSRNQQFKILLKINKCSRYWVFMVFVLITLLAKPADLFLRSAKKIWTVFVADRVIIRANWSDNSSMDIEKASVQVFDSLRRIKWVSVK